MNATGEKKYLILSSETVKNEYLKRHCDENVARILLREPEFDWDMITELDLSYLNVKYLVGLNLVTNLRSLKLTLNGIGKIENLERLTKLERLDLSFNAIEKIENLDALTALEYLDLSHNMISKLENLDRNARLRTFHAAGNRITDPDEIMYMKRFKRLRYMDVSNNAGTVDVRRTVVDNFPDLLYLDGKEIVDGERGPAAPVHDDRGSVGTAATKVTKDPDVLRLAFLYDTDGKQFMNHLFRGDNDGKMLCKWNINVIQAFDAYKKDITKCAMSVYTACLKKLEVRNELGTQYEIAYHAFETEWTNQSRDMIKEYEELRHMRLQPVANDGDVHSTTNIDSGRNESGLPVHDHFSSEELSLTILENELNHIVDRLRERNIYMNECILSMIGKYDKILEEDIKSFLESLNPMFYNMREVENKYSDVLVESIKIYMENPNKKIPTEILTYYGGDRMSILQYALKSTDIHLELMYKREDRLMADAKKWSKGIIEDLQLAERQRFWMVIEETIQYHKQVMAWYKQFIDDS